MSQYPPAHPNRELALSLIAEGGGGGADLFRALGPSGVPFFLIDSPKWDPDTRET